MSFSSRENMWSWTILSQVVVVTCRLENKLGAGVSVVIHNALEFLHCHSVSSVGQGWQKNHEEVLGF